MGAQLQIVDTILLRRDARVELLQLRDRLIELRLRCSAITLAQRKGSTTPVA